MAKPRRPFGPNPPGRLLATMIKVLAAEMSDQQRLSRGKRYHADDAVIDIVIGHGAVTAEVRGSRYEPYVVTIEADGGSGVPRRSEVWAQCTCPDDSGSGSQLCKHAVAALFALSDEVAIEPELVDRWRAGRRRPPSDGVAEVTELSSRRRGDIEYRDATADDTPPDHRAPVIPLSGRRDPDRRGEQGVGHESRSDSSADVLSVLLRSPAGAAPPEFPPVTELQHGALPDPMLRAVLDDALDHLHLRWE